MGPCEELSFLDAELTRLARREGALRLRLGQALEVLGRGACFELGFSSLAGYVLERCERSVRWAEAARGVARRVEGLPLLRAALAAGALSWSKAEILGGVATRESEAAWLDIAHGCTVRELRALVTELAAAGSKRGAKDGDRTGAYDDGVAVGGDDLDEESAERCTLTCTVDREESWLFEATRQLLDQLGARDSEAQVEALLAEAQETLLAALPRDGFELPDFTVMDEAERKWREELGRYRAEAEVRCEGRFREAAASRNDDGVSAEAARGLSAVEGLSAADLDRVVRDVCRAMASHEFELALGLLRFHRGDGWRRLGFATETQYARERLGMSRSSLLGRRGLALRLERLPRVSAALRDGGIGVEGAMQVVRVATPITEAAWLERAGRRTLKHLREEVSAALVAVRISGQRACWPPVERAMDAFHELERAVVSGGMGQFTAERSGGRACVSCGSSDADGVSNVDALRGVNGSWRVMLESLRRWLSVGVQMSAGAAGSAGLHGASAGCRAEASQGRVQLRLRMSRGLYNWWRALEACARRWLPSHVSWLRFLCLSVWRSHRHLLGAEVAYGGIYVRDRYRCTSPVCGRRDVTPHHVQFRSQGGGDEDANVIAVCAWCHLLGIHGGRIRATGTAGHVRWELGRRGSPCLVVEGRQRVAA